MQAPITVQVDETGKIHEVAASAPQLTHDGTPDLGVVRLDVADARAHAALDPLLGHHVATWLASPLTASAAVGEVFSVVPIDRPEGVRDLSWGLYEAILYEVGKAAPAEPGSDEFLDEARSWAQGALRGLPTSALARWRGEDRSRRLMVADRLARSFGLSPESAEQIAGAPPPARSLWSGQDRARLVEARRVAREEAARAHAVAEAKAREAAAPRTWAEMGWRGIAVDRARALSSSDVDFLSLGMPFAGDEREAIYAWRELVGLDLPGGFDLLGVRAIEPGETAPALHRPPQAMTGAVRSYVLSARRHHGALDLGRVREFGEEGFPTVGRFLTKDLVTAYLSPSPDEATLWLTERHIPQLGVRGLRIRPDTWAAMIVAAIDGLTKPPARRSEQGMAFRLADAMRRRGYSMAEGAGYIETPAPETPGRLLYESIGESCVAAVAEGHIGVGEFLEAKSNERKRS